MSSPTLSNMLFLVLPFDCKKLKGGKKKDNMNCRKKEKRNQGPGLSVGYVDLET